MRRPEFLMMRRPCAAMRCHRKNPNRTVPILLLLYLRYYKHDGFNNKADICTQWAEQENANNPSKCDKITITILVNDNDNALTNNHHS